jgi:glycosyltransferase involved in cell wall biosynthesis
VKTCVVIPTYNESRTIGELVNKIRKQGLEALVVDDGSQDNTFQVAEDSGAKVLRNPNNKGKGVSLIKGFDYALANGFDAVITMDGDGQHLCEDIPYFIRLAEYSTSSIFIGNRMFRTQNMPVIRILTNKFMSWIVSGIAGQEIPDTQCGFRLIKSDVLKKVSLDSSKFEIESELIIKAARLGFKIETVPVKTVYNNAKSRINPLTDTLRFFSFIIRQIWTTRF